MSNSDASKRRQSEQDGSGRKRQRQSHEGGDNGPNGYEIKARLDPAYGQRFAFPGLSGEDGGEDELFYGPADDGIQYLKMVRSEAATVPHVVSGNGYGYSTGATFFNDANLEFPEGFSDDEAVIADPDPNDVLEDFDDDEDIEPEPQDAYYAALLQRFRDFRDRLIRQSNEGSSNAADTDLSIVSLPTARHSEWSAVLLNSKPSPSYLASLTQDEVICVIDRLGNVLTKEHVLNETCAENLSTWSWALLAKCRPSGQMASSEIATLRELAKRSQTLHSGLSRLRNGNDDANGAGVSAESNEAPADEPLKHGDDAEPGDGPNLADIQKEAAAETEAARRRLLAIVGQEEDARSPIEERISRAKAMLDIVVTIVGELYGQRDLLNNRVAW